MTTAAILLLALSALLHAAWNFVSKQNRPSAAFFLVANAFGCLVFVPAAVLYGRQYVLFSAHVWWLVVLTGSFLALYFVSLAGAYRAGDLSLVYPLARSSPAIVVVIVTVGLGQGDQIGLYCMLGILLVVAGCFLVPMKTFRDFRLKNYFCRTCALALLAAVGTAGYAVTDAEALRLLQARLPDGSGMVAITLLYALVEAVSGTVFLALYVAARATERVELARVVKSDCRVALLAGTGIYTTYGLVLLSMSLVDNVSYVVGFRQLSIPIGVAMAAVLLKEPITRPKLTGVAILVLGLLLIAIG